MDTVLLSVTCIHVTVIHVRLLSLCVFFRRLKPSNYIKEKDSRCLTNGREVKSGELPQLVSFVYPLDLRSHVFPRFCNFSSFLPKFQRDGVICELSILDMNVEEKKNPLSEQKQVSPLNRRLSDLPQRLNRPLCEVSVTLNTIIGSVNGDTVHGWQRWQ